MFALNSTNTSTTSLSSSTPAPIQGPLIIDGAALTSAANGTFFGFDWSYVPSTDVVMGFFGPGTPRKSEDLTSDEYARLVMPPAPLDDRFAPDWAIKPSPKEMLNRWYVCDSWYPGAYQTTAVVWGLGEGKRQNPTCVKVDLKMG